MFELPMQDMIENSEEQIENDGTNSEGNSIPQTESAPGDIFLI